MQLARELLFIVSVLTFLMAALGLCWCSPRHESTRLLHFRPSFAPRIIDCFNLNRQKKKRQPVEVDRSQLKVLAVLPFIPFITQLASGSSSRVFRFFISVHRDSRKTFHCQVIRALFRLKSENQLPLELSTSIKSIYTTCSSKVIFQISPHSAEKSRCRDGFLLAPA